MTKRIAVLASGRGSNFQAVIEAIAARRIPATWPDRPKRSKVIWIARTVSYGW